jgi:hypothetical protein
MPRLTPLLVLAILSGCSASPPAKPNGGDVDPAITAALADPLMADPQLDRRSNDGALRPADEPYRAMVPPGSSDPLRGGAAPTVVARARTLAGGGFADCSFSVRYSYGWAARLPADLTLPPEAQVAEAAGSDAPMCSLRVIAFSASTGPEAILDSYRRIARAGRYTSSEHKQGPATVLTATRSADGASFIASVTAPDGGSAVDLVSNRGR